MRKFYCKELDEDIEYSRCCNCKEYDECPTRDVIATQRLFGSLIIIILSILLVLLIVKVI